MSTDVTTNVRNVHAEEDEERIGQMEEFVREQARHEDGTPHDWYISPTEHRVNGQRVDIYWCRICKKPEDDVRGEWEFRRALERRQGKMGPVYGARTDEIR